MPRLTLAVLLVVASAAVGFAQEKKDDMRAMNLHPLTKGTKWEGTLTVNGKELDATTEVTEVSEPKKGARAVATLTTKIDKQVTTEEMSADEKGVYRHGMQGQKFETPIFAIKYPVKEGTKWTEKLMMMGTEVEADFEQLKAEEVKVPAGKFTAYPVAMTIKADGQTITATNWYVDGVGMVKQEMEVGGIKLSAELKKFTPAK